MQEEDRKRYNILIDRGNEVFERLESNIFALNNRNMTFIGIDFALLPIIVTAVSILLQIGWKLSTVDISLLCLNISFLFISLAIHIFISKPSDYKDLRIFDKKIFDKMKRMDERKLLSHFLYHLREAYEHNLDIYREQLWWFKIAFHSFITANSILILLVIKNLVPLVISAIGG